MNTPFSITYECNGLTFHCFKAFIDNAYTILILFEYKERAVLTPLRFDSKEDRDYDLNNMPEDVLMDIYDEYIIRLN